MAVLALIGLFALFMALLAIVTCLALGATEGPGAPRTGGPSGAMSDHRTKQYANTAWPTMGVHQVMPSVGCWPGVWVGPAAPSNGVPAGNSAVEVASGPALVQRRRPSTVAARVTSHVVLR